jgi:hypothetical protein
MPRSRAVVRKCTWQWSPAWLESAEARPVNLPCPSRQRSARSQRPFRGLTMVCENWKSTRDIAVRLKYFCKIWSLYLVGRGANSVHGHEMRFWKGGWRSCGVVTAGRLRGVWGLQLALQSFGLFTLLEMSSSATSSRSHLIHISRFCLKTFRSCKISFSDIIKPCLFSSAFEKTTSTAPPSSWK